MLRFGLILVTLGVMMGDSEDLFIPFALVLAGAFLMFNSKEVRHEQADAEAEDSSVVSH